MFFRIKSIHRIISIFIIAIHLVGCSGYRWTTDYDQTVELKGEYKVFINQKYQDHYYQLHDARVLNDTLIGFIKLEDEINSVSRKLNSFVITYEPQINISGIVDLSEISIPFNSIIKVRKFEYSNKTKNLRTFVAVLIPVALIVLIVVEINNMEMKVSPMDGWGSSN
ncbi:hypothetical protein [Carboxylicivirga sp. N1Y90]|uniref:hypothetical protein n=1 Tax=Carboxylicivirga fragile TaxID=3417571 RepID=UPI003D3444E2|nr:hypothetical protein [Marinilabiliaceae bacterium N1Y90]